MSTDFAVLASQPENETNPIAQKLSGKKELDEGTRIVSDSEAKRMDSQKQRVQRTGTTPTASPSPRKRKSKNETGIWIIEKSLDKKNWMPDGWVPTRAIAVKTAKSSEERSYREALGIHYRVTRYEPTR